MTSIPAPLSSLGFASASIAPSTPAAAPALGTTGGTSDARFIKDHCTVAELGLLNATAHKVDENAPLDDLARLTAIYRAVLERYLPR